MRGVSDGALSGLGIKEAQKVGWSMRGRERARECVHAAERERVQGRVGAMRAWRWGAGRRRRCRKRVWESMAVGVWGEIARFLRARLELESAVRRRGLVPWEILMSRA